MLLKLMHTNDFHGHLTQKKVELLHKLRKDVDFYFDCGDGIKSGNLGIPIKPDHYWKYLAELNCTASVLGNRETHLLESAFQKKIEGCKHSIVCCNMYYKNGDPVFEGSIMLEHHGFKIGIVGCMVPMITLKHKAAPISQYLWEKPIPKMTEVAQILRPQVDYLIALTHIGFKQDLQLAETELFDAILGGHSHTLLQEPTEINNTWIFQTGSHAHYAGIYEIDTDTKQLRNLTVKHL